ncbi:hypothetical protein FACS1894217_04190 [Clostridia bacterium]|nr:hypothetical protein FACS1894217_04190 [Clostridia bacterium]
MSKARYNFEDIGSNLTLAFAADCEQDYERRVADTARIIAARSEVAPLVLLAGPSGSGKTTTASKLRDEVQRLGHPCRAVSMDDYYLSVNPDTHPRTERGDIDFESPYCLDIPLFHDHLTTLLEGGTAQIPSFDFAAGRRRDAAFMPLEVKRGDICIFEGIHALNPLFFKDLEDYTQRVYISARADIYSKGQLFFKGTWVRLVRRMVRDANFRGWDAAKTMTIWGDIRRGEKKYISPYWPSANIALDTHMPYETLILKRFALPLLAEIPHCEREAELREMAAALAEIPDLPLEYVPKHSLLREFIG